MKTHVVCPLCKDRTWYRRVGDRLLGRKLLAIAPARASSSYTHQITIYNPTTNTEQKGFRVRLKYPGTTLLGFEVHQCKTQR